MRYDSSASPLDILCKVAAAEGHSAPGPPPISNSPAPHPQPHFPPPQLPPLLPALHPHPSNSTSASTSPSTNPTPHHPPPFRLSSSAPPNPSPLQHSVIPLAPLHPLPSMHSPHHPYHPSTHSRHNSYYNNNLHQPPAKQPQEPFPPHTATRHFPAMSPTPNTVTNPPTPPHQPSPFDPPLVSALHRNLSAPSLTDNPLTNSNPIPASHPSPLSNPPHPSYFPPASQSISIPTPTPPVPVPIPSRLPPTRYSPHLYPPPNLPGSAPSSYTHTPPSSSTPIFPSSPPLRRTSPASANMKSLTSRTTKSGRRDSYTRFTPEEEAMLLEGVRVFGAGNWKKILNSYRFHWKRTAVDLKDKYRNITRAKLRRINASTSASDLSSAGSETDANSHALALSPPTARASPMQCSPLRSQSIVAGGGGFSPISTSGGSMESAGGGEAGGGRGLTTKKNGLAN